MAAKEMPKVGDKVWYRLGDYQHNYEWLPATVVDRINKDEFPGMKETEIYDTPNDGALHLRVEVSREKHHAAKSTVYRQNIPGPGTEPGMWALEKPDNADKEFAKIADERKRSAEFHRERMRESSQGTRGR